MRRYGAGETKNIIPDAQQCVAAQGRIAMRRPVQGKPGVNVGHGEYNVLNRYKEKPALSRRWEYSVSHRCKEYTVLSWYGSRSVRRRERNVSGTAWGLLFETAVGFFLEAVRFIICLFMVFTAEFSF